MSAGLLHEMQQLACGDSAYTLGNWRTGCPSPPSYSLPSPRHRLKRLPSRCSTPLSEASTDWTIAGWVTRLDGSEAADAAVREAVWRCDGGGVRTPWVPSRTTSVSARTSSPAPRNQSNWPPRSTTRRTSMAPRTRCSSPCTAGTKPAPTPPRRPRAPQPNRPGTGTRTPRRANGRSAGRAYPGSSPSRPIAGTTTSANSAPHRASSSSRSEPTE